MGALESLFRLRFDGPGGSTSRAIAVEEVFPGVRRQAGRGHAGARDDGYLVGFISRLEATRGIAALVVAAFHAAQAPIVAASLATQGSWPGARRLMFAAPDFQDAFWGRAFRTYLALCNGQGAVNFFFVLSGFVLAVSLHGGPRDLRLAARRFFTGRVFRIYPAVIAAVLLFASIYWTSGAYISPVPASFFGLDSLLRNMLLSDFRIDGVTWSLQVELIAAPLIFAAVLMSRRWGHAPLVLLAMAFVLLSFNKRWNHAIALHPSRLGPLYCFLFGILVGSIGREIALRLNGPAARRLFVAAVLVFFAARPVLGGESHWTMLAEASASALLIAIIVYGGVTDFARPLDWPVIRFYGRISYSFYLLHPVSLIVVWNIPGQVTALLNAGVPSVAVALGLAVLSAAAITPLAWLSWRFVEVPGIALGRRLLRDRPSAALA